MHKGVIIVAGGKGTRMGNIIPKQFLLLNGIPIIVRTIKQFFAFDPDIPIVLVLPQQHWEHWFEHCAEHFTLEENKKISLARGGETRTLSVWNGLQIFRLINYNQFGGKTCMVAIHDAVRPLITVDHIGECYDACLEKRAVVSGVAVKNSLRQQGENGTFSVDRSLFLEVHTPQVFDFELLWKSYQYRPHHDFSDDATVFEAYWKEKHPVQTCLGSYNNIKITTPDDLLLAEMILKNQH